MTPNDQKSRVTIPTLARYVPEMPEDRDRDALLLLRRRDPRGFDLAYQQYAERVFGFLVRLSRSRSIAEDLFQHTFLRLAEVGPSLRTDSDLRAWLFSVARNAFYSHVRARRVETQARSQPEFQPSQSGAGPESGLLLGEIDRALFSLNREDRELLLLVGVESMSYLEVADILGIDQVTARKRVSRARARFAQALDDEARGVSKSESMS